MGEGFEQSMNDDMDAEPNMTQKKEKSNQPGGEQSQKTTSNKNDIYSTVHFQSLSCYGYTYYIYCTVASRML